jgi:hypothetical protein
VDTESINFTKSVTTTNKIVSECVSQNNNYERVTYQDTLNVRGIQQKQKTNEVINPLPQLKVSTAKVEV